MSKQKGTTSSATAPINPNGCTFSLNTQRLTTRNQTKVLDSLKDATSFLQQQQKKKRSALENISNASGSSATGLSTSSNKAETTTKRSKYSVFAVSSVISSKRTATVATAAATTQSKTNIKENLSSLIPTTFGSNLLPASFNPSISKANVGASATGATGKVALKGKTSSTIVINHKSALPIIPKWIETKSKDSKTSNEPTTKKTVESSSSIEHQLAITSLDSMETSSSSTSNPMEDLAFIDDNKNDWEDIDAADQDEFNASDYAAFIFEYYRERESHFVIDDYITRQPNLNRQMRLLLVDWMVEVQQQLEFSHEVLYLSVKLLDLYLNARKIEKEKLQLLGGAAMFIACKFEERMPPIIDDFIYVSDSAYDRTELIKMEIDVLKTVQFDVGCPLSYTFLRRYSKCIKADMKFLTLARYILELSLQDYGFAHVQDSLKACAALYLAIKMVVVYENRLKQSGANETPAISSDNLTDTEWNATLVHYTGSYTRDFIDHITPMNNLTKTAFNSKYKTIFKKYSHHVFFEVAKIPHLSDENVAILISNSKSENSF